MIIKKILQNAPIPLLEAEVLLAFILKKDRTYLHTWSDKSIASIKDTDPDALNQFKKLVARRIEGEPIAYLVGEKEFWSLTFKVTHHVLIPRPESELLIEEILKLRSDPSLHFKPMQRVLDLGTGSGCIAISLGYECPKWKIIAVDQSEQALLVAKNNAQRLGVKNIHFLKSSWYSVFNHQDTNKDLNALFHIIVSNPPYLAESDPHLLRGDCRYEPKAALTDFEDGLSAYREIISGASHYLKTEGWLLLEHGHKQGAAIREIMRTHDFHAIKTVLDLALHERITICQK